MALDPETSQNAGLAGWAIFGTGTFALIATVIRKQLRGLSSDSVGIRQDSAQKDTLGQMRDEIARLETLVMRMGRRMSAMEERVASSSQALLEAQMMLIDVERETLGCETDCANSLKVRVKLNEAHDLLSKASQENAKPIVVEDVPQ